MRTKLFLTLILFVSFSTLALCQSEMSVAKTFKDKTIEWGGCPEFMPKGCQISVLHGDPAKPNVDILFKVPAGADIPKHWHSSAERMILLEGELTVTYDNETPVKLKKGMYAYGPSKKPHIAKCSNKSSCTLFIAFEEPLDAFPMTKAN